MVIQLGRNAIPITELAEVKVASGPTIINRKNRMRKVTVGANISEGALGDKIKELEEQFDEEISLPPGYKIHFGGMAEMMGDAFSDLFTVLIMAIILTYMLLAAIL